MSSSRLPAYYNENDPYLCQWLRNLIDAKLIPAGEVDPRSITEVQPDDLIGFAQCHFFAGIGGFAYAARLAGWPDDKPLWTGGFPCQPFSVAGRQRAQDDDRYLWPSLHRLVASGRPPWFLGENVTGLVGLALDRVLADLEGARYATRPLVVPACAVDAPHRRDRVWIIARDVAADDRADGTGQRRGEARSDRAGAAQRAAGRRSGLEHATCERRRERRPAHGVRGGRPTAARPGGADRVGDADQPGSQGRRVAGDRAGEWAPWTASRTVAGRRVPESGVCVLAHGISARVPKLRAAGNAIVPQVAARLLRAMLAAG